MRGVPFGLACLLALAGAPARAADFVPLGTVMLFPPGSAVIEPAARNALLGYLRPPRPPGLRGHCLRGHADRGPDPQALSLARARAVAAMLARQGVDPADVALDALGDSAPVRLSPPGQPEPMNDRVELIPCPGPRLAGVPAAEDLALDAATLPGAIAVVAPRVARAIGCIEPVMPGGMLSVPRLDCPEGVPHEAVPALTVRRLAGTRRIAVTLEWPAGLPAGEAGERAVAAAEAMLRMYGHVPAAPVLAALVALAGAAPLTAFDAGPSRAEVEAGPGPLRRLRLVPKAGWLP